MHLEGLVIVYPINCWRLLIYSLKSSAPNLKVGNCVPYLYLYDVYLGRLDYYYYYYASDSFVSFRRSAVRFVAHK